MILRTSYFQSLVRERVPAKRVGRRASSCGFGRRIDFVWPSDPTMSSLTLRSVCASGVHPVGKSSPSIHLIDKNPLIWRAQKRWRCRVASAHRRRRSAVSATWITAPFIRSRSDCNWIDGSVGFESNEGKLEPSIWCSRFHLSLSLSLFFFF